MSDLPPSLAKLPTLKKKEGKSAPRGLSGAAPLVLSRQTTLLDGGSEETVTWQGLQLSALANLIVGRHPSRVLMGALATEIGRTIPDEAISIHFREKNNAECVLVAHEGIQMELVKRIFTITPGSEFGFLLDGLEGPILEEDLWARAPEAVPALEFLRKVWGFSFSNSAGAGMLLVWGDEDANLSGEATVTILSLAHLLGIFLDEGRLNHLANEISAQAQGRRISLEKALGEFLSANG